MWIPVNSIDKISTFNGWIRDLEFNLAYTKSRFVFRFDNKELSSRMNAIRWNSLKKEKLLVIYIYNKENVNECCTTLVKNLIKESFYGKRKKKAINVLIAFFISHKSDIKTFLKWILNQCRTALVNMTHIIIGETKRNSN